MAFKGISQEIESFEHHDVKLGLLNRLTTYQAFISWLISFSKKTDILSHWMLEGIIVQQVR